MAVPERKDIPVEDTWALEDLYATDEKFWEDFENAKQYIEKLAKFEGKLAESPEILLDYFKLGDELSVKFDSLIHYACRKGDEDTREAKYQDMYARLMNLINQISVACSFDVNEILAISDEKLDEFYATKPELELYRRKLDKMRCNKEHILSPSEEKLLAQVDQIANDPENIFSMLNDADMQFPNAKDANGEEHTLTHSTYNSIMRSDDRKLRKSAFHKMYKTYGKHKNTLAATLGAQARMVNLFASARKYPSALAAALNSTEVPESVYYNLIEAVRSNFPAMYRYVSLRKRLMGVKNLHFYDIYAPIVKNIEINIDFEEAKRLCLEAVKPLGEEYCNIMREGFENRWIDVRENVGKRSGAYSAGARVHPYVLLNYNNTLNDVFTLIHEMGHSIHSYLSNREQPVAYSNYVIFVAEVASTCNEALLMEYLLKITTDKDKRAYLINYFLEQFRTTLYRQTMFAEFELKIAEMAQRGEGITADACCEIYKQLNIDYFGNDIVIDDEIALEWAKVPHFYYDFYVYQYATGYAAAIALSRRILSEGETAVKDYISFLSGGCSKTPIELLKIAGVDMSTPDPVNSALKVFDGLVTEMEKLCN